MIILYYPEKQTKEASHGLCMYRVTLSYQVKHFFSNCRVFTTICVLRVTKRYEDDSFFAVGMRRSPKISNISGV